MNIIFISWYGEIILCQMHLFCAKFDKKTGRSDFDLFLPIFGGHDSTADSSKLSRLKYFFSHFNCFFFLYFGLNLKHKAIPDIHFCKQTKLSKTMVVPIRYNGRTN